MPASQAGQELEKSFPATLEFSLHPLTVYPRPLPMFPFALKLTALHLPATPEGSLEQIILGHEILAASEQQVHCVQLEIENGSEDALVELLETLEAKRLPAGVYSLLLMMELHGGQEADSPIGPGEYWTELTPKGDTYIQRLKRDESLPLLEEHVKVDQDLLDLVFPGEPKPDPTVSDTVQLER